MKVYTAHDGKLRVRIGHENLGSESLGPWYGGTGAIRLRQVLDGWFRASRLDYRGHRGTAALAVSELWRVREHLPRTGAMDVPSRGLSVRVPDDELRMLHERVAPLRKRVARFGPDLAVMFGDFEIAPVASSAVGLFHFGGNRFNAFRTGLHWAALGEDGMPLIAAHLSSARLRREGGISVVEVDRADLHILLGMAWMA